MESAGAGRIIEGYLQILQTVGELLPFGVPDSLLAHPREEIRRALREAASASGGSGLLLNAGVNLGDLRTAYQSLASFLPYDEAHAAARLHHAMQRGDYAFLSTAAAQAASGLARRIEQEASRLAREFDALLGAPADPLLAEVDAFLSQFDRKQKTPAG